MSKLPQKNAHRLHILQQHLQPNSFQQKQQVSLQLTSNKKTQRAVIVAGVRTPFCRAFTDLMEVDAIGLGCAAVSGLLKKTKLDPTHIDEIIWGNVVMNPSAPNVAREIVVDLNLPTKITGVTVSRACISGLQAILQAVHLIEHGDAECVIAGGSDSMSNAEVTLPKKLTHAMAMFKQSKEKGVKKYIEFFKNAGNPLTWKPVQPAITERSTGKTMGYHADLMGEINQITRESQDALAITSHTNASRARKMGILDEEICPVVLKNGKQVSKDNLIRDVIDKAKIAKLKPVFRKAKQNGTVTAATSSPLTDGGSAVLIMSEEKAKQLGFPTDIVIKSSAISAVDPFPQLLLAPALAIPKALDDAGLTLDDIDFVEMHEAFAAQVLSTTACLASETFCKKKLGRDKPVGMIPANKLNINGGSIAIGHPFSATGGRIVTSAMNELRRSNKKYCLISICAAGGMGAAVILERRQTQSSTQLFEESV